MRIELNMKKNIGEVASIVNLLYFNWKFWWWVVSQLVVTVPPTVEDFPHRMSRFAWYNRIM